MEARYTDILAARRRLRFAMFLAAVNAVIGWVGLWFLWDDRWMAFVAWGVGNLGATLLVIALAMMRCPRCQRRGYIAVSKASACPHCGLVEE